MISPHNIHHVREFPISDPGLITLDLQQDDTKQKQQSTSFGKKKKSFLFNYEQIPTIY